jgi:hypothetical protein
MERAGLPTPKNFLLDDATQLAAAAAHVGFPVRPPAPPRLTDLHTLRSC